MFRVTLGRIAPGGGVPFYHANIYAREGEAGMRWRLCGIVAMNEAEWTAFGQVCSTAGIEVYDEVPPSPAKAS
jgi:hypothetical protein